MDIETISLVRDELQRELAGQRWGKVFPLSRFELAVDMHARDGRYLFISIEPAEPRVYLIKRRLRDLEKQSSNPSPFVLALKKQLSDALLINVDTVERERILRLFFETPNVGERFTLVVQLTGRSANLFLLDSNEIIVATARPPDETQAVGERYTAPERPHAAREMQAVPRSGGSISDRLDAEYAERRAEREFRALANNARSRITSEIKRKEKLIKNLKGDLKQHGDADRWKRFGDILLSNTATATRKNGAFLVTDHFEEQLPSIEIPYENEDSLPETAEKYFRRYTKARNAAEEIAKRLAETESELADLHQRLVETDEHIAERNIDALSADASELEAAEKGSRRRDRTSSGPSGYRTFISSDGFEILVGKKAKDNDQLTLRVAKSLDIWMHAADYPGSHVVIRDSGKRTVPPQTLLEAAQLAAFYSQGRKQVKAAVHHTQKKFVNKPKGAAPGLVSLSSFKTLLVEPAIPEKIKRK